MVDSQGSYPTTNGVCPECGGTEVDPCVGYFRSESGEIEGYDVDPSCAKCGYPWGNDWYQSSPTTMRKHDV